MRQKHETQNTYLSPPGNTVSSLSPYLISHSFFFEITNLNISLSAKVQVLQLHANKKKRRDAKLQKVKITCKYSAPGSPQIES